MTTTEAIEQGAQLYLPFPGDPTGKTAQMFYRWTACRRSDGSVGIGLSYISHTGCWQGSSERKPKPYASKSLVPIPGARQGVYQIEPTSGLPHPTEEEIKEAWERL